MRINTLLIVFYLMSLIFITSCSPINLDGQKISANEKNKEIGSINCQNLTHTTTIDSRYGKAIGKSPVWAIFSKDEPIINLSDYKYAEKKVYGTAVKLLWVVESASSNVTITGVSSDGTPLWFSINGFQDSKQPVLDLDNPVIPKSNDKYVEFPSQIYIPKTGCYALEIKSQSTSWMTSFQVNE